MIMTYANGQGRSNNSYKAQSSKLKKSFIMSRPTDVKELGSPLALESQALDAKRLQETLARLEQTVTRVEERIACVEETVAKVKGEFEAPAGPAPRGSGRQTPSMSEPQVATIRLRRVVVYGEP